MYLHWLMENIKGSTPYHTYYTRDNEVFSVPSKAVARPEFKRYSREQNYGLAVVGPRSQFPHLNLAVVLSIADIAEVTIPGSFLLWDRTGGATLLPSLSRARPGFMDVYPIDHDSLDKEFPGSNLILPVRDLGVLPRKVANLVKMSVVEAYWTAVKKIFGPSGGENVRGFRYFRGEHPSLIIRIISLKEARRRKSFLRWRIKEPYARVVFGSAKKPIARRNYGRLRVVR